MQQPDFSKQSARDIIKAEFVGMYKSLPLNHISVSSLSTACNMSRGTFYLYFKDVRALYRECEYDLINHMDKELPEVVLCTVATDYEKYVAAFHGLLRCIIEKLDDYKCFLNGSEEASFRQAWFESIRKHFIQSIVFSRSISPEQHDYFTRFFAGGTYTVLNYWILNDCREPAEDIANASAQILFKGAFLAK